MERIYSIDGFRVIAAFLVVSLHVDWPINGLSFMADIARIAVPFFLMVSGYFYRPESTYKNIARCLKYLAIAAITYFFVEWFLYRNLSFVTNELSKLDYRFWLFNVTPFCPVGWYLAAYIYILLIAKVFRYDVAIYVLGLFSFVLALIVGPYKEFLGLECDSLMWNCSASCTFCWFALGKFLRCHEFKKFSMANIVMLLVVVVAIFSQCFEHFLIKTLTHVSCSGTAYIFTPLAMILLFQFLLQNKNVLKPLCLEKCALWIFLSHIAIHYILVSLFYPSKFSLPYAPLVEINYPRGIVNNFVVFAIAILLYQICVQLKYRVYCNENKHSCNS